MVEDEKEQEDRLVSDEQEEDRMVLMSEEVAAIMKDNFDEWLKQELGKNDVTALIFYRGFWCKLLRKRLFRGWLLCKALTSLSQTSFSSRFLSCSQ